MERCPLCKKRFWPWSGGIVYNSEFYHPICYQIKYQSNRLDRFIDLMAEQNSVHGDVLKAQKDLIDYQKQILLLEKSVDLRDQDLMKKVMALETQIAEIIEHQQNTLEYYPEILEEVRKNQTILDLKIATREQIEDLSKHQHTISLFDPILMQVLLKTTGLTPDEVLRMITNKEIKRMLNDIKKQDQGGK